MRQVTIHVLQYAKSDLLLAYSKDVPGLMVQGRSIAQIEERLPGAIKQIIEANEGMKVEVSPLEHQSTGDIPHMSWPHILSAHLTEANA